MNKRSLAFWQEQHLFELRQCWDAFHFHQNQIKQCDQAIDNLLAAKTKEEHLDCLAYQPEKKKRVRKNDPNPMLDTYAFQLSEGVDLMEVDGVGRSLILTVLSETGLDLKSKFPSFKHYVSWLTLCPNKKTSGGKVISSKTKKTKNNSAAAYRQAALNLGKEKRLRLSQILSFHSLSCRQKSCYYRYS